MSSKNDKLRRIIVQQPPILTSEAAIGVYEFSPLCCIQASVKPTALSLLNLRTSIGIKEAKMTSMIPMIKKRLSISDSMSVNTL